ncbi:hypothetical protein [Scytonema sp. NUACC21]
MVRDVQEINYPSCGSGVLARSIPVAFWKPANYVYFFLIAKLIPRVPNVMRANTEVGSGIAVGGSNTGSARAMILLPSAS